MMLYIPFNVRAVTLAMLLMLITASAALAHAQLLTSSPTQGAILDQAPTTLELTFSEPVSALVIGLLAPDGTRTDLTDVTTSGEVLKTQVPQDLIQGSYVMSWRVVSVDGHPVAGSLIFSLGAETGTNEIEPPLSQRLVAAALWGTKILVFVGLFFGVGTAVFSLVAPMPNPIARFAASLTGVGLFAVPISVGLHGLDALGLSFTDLWSAAPWRTALSTSYGSMALVAELALGLGLLALVVRRLRFLVWGAWVLTAIAFAMSGHASSADPQWLTRSLVAVHIAGIVFWLGALYPLWQLLRRKDEQAKTALVRFSKLVPFAVIPLLLSGFALAVVQLGWPGAHWLSPYAAILAAKLALIAILLGLAVWNRLWLTKPAFAGNLHALQHLQRSISVEIVLVVLILALVAGWRFTPPPRTLALTKAAMNTESPLFAHIMDAEVMANITLQPGIVGLNVADIQLTDVAVTLLVPLEVKLTLSAPKLGIEPFSTNAVAHDESWRIENLTIPAPGIWHLTLDVRMSRFNLVRLETALEVL